MSSESTVRIGALLPEVLSTYSDGGNVTVLAQRLRWRGIPVEVCTIPAAGAPPTDCDLYVLGGGEDAAQVFAGEWLGRQSALRSAMASRATTFAVCAGLQLLGTWMEDPAGRRHPGAGLLDLTTRPGLRRSVGEVVTWCALPGVGTLTGFENHRGVTSLGPGTTPLGEVLHGIGNGTPGRAEGVLTDRIIGTYLHGPVLARNPALADAVLSMVTGQTLAPLDLPDQADGSCRPARRAAGDRETWPATPRSWGCLARPAATAPLVTG